MKLLQFHTTKLVFLTHVGAIVVVIVSVLVQPLRHMLKHVQNEMSLLIGELKNGVRCSVEIVQVSSVRVWMPAQKLVKIVSSMSN